MTAFDPDALLRAADDTEASLSEFANNLAPLLRAAHAALTVPPFERGYAAGIMRVTTAPPEGEDAKLIERLYVMAPGASEASRIVAEDRAARLGGEYMWLKPEETTEWKAAARLAQLAAEIQRVREYAQSMDALAEERLTRAERAEARCERMREALTPFVKFIKAGDGPVLGYGGHRGPGLTASAPDDRVLLRPDPSTPALTVGDFRRAKAALAETADD